MSIDLKFPPMPAVLSEERDVKDPLKVVYADSDELARLREVEASAKDMMIKMLHFFVTRDVADQERLNQSIVTLAAKLGVVAPDTSSETQEGGNGQ